MFTFTDYEYKSISSEVSDVLGERGHTDSKEREKALTTL